jgi:hypothetical protein
MTTTSTVQVQPTDVVTTEETKVETNPVTEQTTSNNESEPTKAELDKVRQQQMLDQQRFSYQQMLEDNGHYNDLGCFYAAGAPIANAAGAELGIVTTDDKTGEVRRSGIGIYLRCDHLGGTPAKKVKIEC